MATTARIPEALKQEADTYARGLGISLNALLAVALRDYLDARRGLASGPGRPAVPAVLVESVAAAQVVELVPDAALESVAAALPVEPVPAVDEDSATAAQVVELVPGEPVPGEAAPKAQAAAVPPIRRPLGGGRKACPCGSGYMWNACHGRPGGLRVPV